MITATLTPGSRIIVLDEGERDPEKRTHSIWTVVSASDDVVHLELRLPEDAA